MKSIIMTLVLVGLCSTGFASLSDSLSRANQLYSEGKYQEAVDVYNGVLSSGQESAELYFNLGNSYYKNGELAPAILNYERAKLLAPNDEDIIFNIGMANQLIVDQLEALPQPFFTRFWKSLVNKNSADRWGKISIVLFVLALVTLILFMFSRMVAFKKISFSVMVIALFLSVSTFVLAQQQHAMRTHSRGAVVFSPTVTVKASPSDSGTAIFVIHEGLKVEVVDAVGEWYQIKLSDGNVGWMRKDELQVI